MEINHLQKGMLLVVKGAKVLAPFVIT
jgi:hypothetical protein